jgi:hypothetical protein
MGGRERDDLLDASSRALDRVLEYPVMDNAMLAEKMELPSRNLVVRTS